MFCPGLGPCIYASGVGLPFEYLPARTVISASLTSNSSRTAPKLSPMSVVQLEPDWCDLPVTTDFGEQLCLHDFDLVLGQILEVDILNYFRPSHNRRNLPVKRQTIAEIQQLHQVWHRDIRHLMWVLFFRALRNVRIRWRRSHQCVSANCFLRVVRAYHEELHVIHAGALETVGAVVSTMYLTQRNDKRTEAQKEERVRGYGRSEWNNYCWGGGER